MGEAAVTFQVQFAKIDEERRIVSGWASVAKNADGSLPHDTQGDVIDTAEAIRAWDDAWIEYAKSARTGDIQHEVFNATSLIEMLIVTPEKATALAKAIGATLPETGSQFVGAWVSYQLDESDVCKQAWADVKAGKLTAFSIVGSGERVELSDAA